MAFHPIDGGCHTMTTYCNSIIGDQMNLILIIVITFCLGIWVRNRFIKVMVLIFSLSLFGLVGLLNLTVENHASIIWPNRFSGTSIRQQAEMLPEVAQAIHKSEGDNQRVWTINIKDDKEVILVIPFDTELIPADHIATKRAIADAIDRQLTDAHMSAAGRCEFLDQFGTQVAGSARQPQSGMGSDALNLMNWKEDHQVEKLNSVIRMLEYQYSCV